MADARRIVVTGVSRGCGRALVDRFASLGHRVIGCARSAEAIGALRAQYETAGHDFSVVDVADAAAVAAWADRIVAAVGAPDLVINNAGLIHPNARLWEIPVSEMSRVIDVNLKGTAYVCRSFLPAMIESGRGVVANFSSGWGRSTSPEVAIYCASKWAVEGLTRALAQELPRGLAAVPVNPGVIYTEMLDSCFDDASAYPDPERWSRRAGPFLLQLGAKDNGVPVSVS